VARGFVVLAFATGVAFGLGAGLATTFFAAAFFAAAFFAGFGAGFFAFTAFLGASLFFGASFFDLLLLPDFAFFVERALAMGGERYLPVRGKASEISPRGCESTRAM
jgi:hypothetical protein